MRNLLNVMLVFAITIFANSCKKDATKGESIDHTKDFLNEVRVKRSDRSSSYFIRGEFDGKLIYCTSNLNAADDAGWNTQFINNLIGVDQINLIRQDQLNTVQIAIYFEKTNIFNRQFPYKVSNGNGEFAEIDLINLQKLGSTVQGSPQDNYSFWETTYKALKVQVTSLINNTMEGTFEGYLKSNTGSIITVKNGRFRIKITVVDENK